MADRRSALGRAQERIVGIPARLRDRGQARLLRRFDGAVVLLYHRVAHLDPDPFSMAVPPEHFADHLRVIRARCEPLSLAELVAALRRRRLPRRGVVVTFDDGYADNLHAAEPLLTAHQVPATVFVATGYVETRREFWWDELERLVKRAADSAVELRLEVGGRRFAYERLTQVAATTALADLQFALRRATADEIAASVEALRASVGAPAGMPVRDTHRPLEPDELRLLARDELIEIGAHTRWHACLARASSAEQQDELAGSKRHLEDWLDQRVNSVSFPFGRRTRDYTRRTVRIARQVGFERAAVRFPARVTALTSPLQIPRVVAPALPGGEFERWLEDRFAR